MFAYMYFRRLVLFDFSWFMTTNSKIINFNRFFFERYGPKAS